MQLMQMGGKQEQRVQAYVLTRPDDVRTIAAQINHMVDEGWTIGGVLVHGNNIGGRDTAHGLMVVFTRTVPDPEHPPTPIDD